MDELADVIAGVLKPEDPEAQRIDVTAKPTVILMVGRQRHRQDDDHRQARLAPQGDGDRRARGRRGDTFRAAAVEQLDGVGAARWTARSSSGGRAATPAAVAFDGVAAARARGADVVIVDTAGRLHTQDNLMRGAREGAPGHREAAATAPRTRPCSSSTRPRARTACARRRQFQQAVDVTGVVLTKLDGTAKGGIVVAIHETLGIPIKLIGMGEQLAGPAPVRAGRLRARHLRRGRRGDCRRVTLPQYTERLIVREFVADDLDMLATVVRRSGGAVVGAGAVHARADRRLAPGDARQYEEDGIGVYAVVIAASGEIIGDCGPACQEVEGERLPELGWDLRSDRWGHGYATEAARGVLLHAADLGLERLWSLIAPHNARSRAVAQRLGMTWERDVVWHDAPHELWRLDLP